MPLYNTNNSAFQHRSPKALIYKLQLLGPYPTDPNLGNHEKGGFFFPLRIPTLNLRIPEKVFFFRLQFLTCDKNGDLAIS